MIIEIDLWSLKDFFSVHSIHNKKCIQTEFIGILFVNSVKKVNEEWL